MVWNISTTSLVIFAVSVFFEISCAKTDRQTHKRRCKPYPRDCCGRGSVLTSVQSNLATSRIVDLSPLAAANAFVRSWPHRILVSLVPQESASQTASRSVQPFFGQHVRVTNAQTDKQTDHATCDICSKRPISCVACRRCGLKMYKNLIIEHIFVYLCFDMPLLFNVHFFS